MTFQICYLSDRCKIFVRGFVFEVFCQSTSVVRKAIEREVFIGVPS